MTQLMTAEVEKALKKYPIRSQDGKGGDSKIIVKYFGGSAATWLITEGEPQPNGDWLLYGFITLGLPDDFAPGKLLWIRDAWTASRYPFPSVRTRYREGHFRQAGKM